MKIYRLLLLGLTLASLAHTVRADDPTPVAGEDPDRDPYHRITSPEYSRQERDAARQEYIEQHGYDPGYVDPGYSTQCDPSVSECF